MGVGLRLWLLPVLVLGSECRAEQAPLSKNELVDLGYRTEGDLYTKQYARASQLFQELDFSFADCVHLGLAAGNVPKYLARVRGADVFIAVTDRFKPFDPAAPAEATVNLSPITWFSPTPEDMDALGYRAVRPDISIPTCRVYAKNGVRLGDLCSELGLRMSDFHRAGPFLPSDRSFWTERGDAEVLVTLRDAARKDPLLESPQIVDAQVGIPLGVLGGPTTVWKRLERGGFKSTGGRFVTQSITLGNLANLLEFSLQGFVPVAGRPRTFAARSGSLSIEVTVGPDAASKLTDDMLVDAAVRVFSTDRWDPVPPLATPDIEFLKANNFVAWAEPSRARKAFYVRKRIVLRDLYRLFGVRPPAHLAAVLDYGIYTEPLPKWCDRPARPLYSFRIVMGEADCYVTFWPGTYRCDTDEEAVVNAEVEFGSEWSKLRAKARLEAENVGQPREP
jgi:hypothetical protein